jgi:gamma-glutamylcyclotransferase (GGCT)/AIG2-like uncharacterized protein YtfP
MWLQGGLDEADRPDRLGAVLDVVVEAGVQRLSIREARAGTYDASPRLQAIAARYRESMPVKLSSAERALDPDAPFRLFLADGEERRVARETVEVWRGAVLERRERLPWAERMLRRGLLAWQGWRLRRRYARPSEFMPGPVAIFCYGTLLFPEVLRRVAGADLAAGPATASGWARYRVRGEVFPALVAEPGALTRGALVTGVDALALARLDAFEGPLYERRELEVEREDGTRVRAQSWVLAAGREAELTREPWDPEAFAKSELRAFSARVAARGSPYAEAR